MKALGKRSVASFLTVVLNATWWLMAIGLALSAVLLICSSLVDTPLVVDAGWLAVGSNSTMSIPVSFSLDSRTERVTSPSLGIEEAQVESARGTLKFPARQGTFLTANAVVLVGSFALAMWVVTQLRAVVRTLRDGQPFVPANAARLRWVGWGVIAGEVARAGIVFFESAYAKTHFVADGLRFEARPDVSVIALVSGLIILAIAEVFRTGSRLAEEQSLTV